MDANPSEAAQAEEMAHWAAMLRALPIPAAIVDRTGEVRAANRWIDAGVGSVLLHPVSDELARGMCFGVDGVSRWRVRPLDDEATLMIATGEREDAGDHLLRKFFSSGDAMFVVYDQFGRIIESNAAWGQLLGYSDEEVFGLESWSLLPPDDLDTRHRVEQELRFHGRSEPLFRMRASDGSYRTVQWALHFDASVGRCFGIGRDVTDRDRLTVELQHLAYTDQLTGLANRTNLIETLENHLDAGHVPSVLFCDLDRFKVINDSLGHQAGDDLLAGLGRRLAAVAADHGGIVARLGGDEFVALLRDADRERAVSVAKEILAAMDEPILAAGRPVHVRMSIGIALGDTSTSRTPLGLLGEADTAAYRSKELGRNRYTIFDGEMRASVDRRFNVEAGLRTAIEQDEIVAHYQPIVAMPGGGIVGIEALMRWRSLDGHLWGPGAFIDVAEDAGLMPRIGYSMLRQAFTTGAAYAAAGRPLITSVNVSAAELATVDYADQVLGLVYETGIAPESVLLEITESAVINTDVALPTLRALRATGLKIGLDDFGTGFSSLAHLRTLPIDVVKVDRSFVVDMVDDAVTRAVTASVVDLCTALDLDVVLEGIETTDQAAAAEQLGATMAQGYLFHKPMPRSALDALLGLPESQRSAFGPG
ncbi:MAG: EAL domain-containing protein [Actinomycetota bacterium]